MIFQKVSRELRGIIDSGITVSVWVFSEEPLTLKSIMPMLEKTSGSLPCFIFGTESYQRVFNRIPNHNNLCFIDATVSSQVAMMVICAALINYALTGRCSDNEKKIMLSGNEKEIVHMLSDGMRPKEIANKTGLSIKTISAHKRSAMRKLNVRTNMELLVKYRLAQL
ncbi:LuxR C-terminal-related transcriptional regulator [Enterobacter sp. SORGH_AS_0287]|uniref:helix-turn-helix domain-containing protein n=1 Tax=Enterobacter sp. SORGH_AS_0287 TaxID=3041779 RepID=UPI00285734ED|nr:LuxR C-terminal-related transcriptional regulator [Enterobacter sp. SORGH_AS_0287]MDR6366998.1 DNA-binding CsgD family transcriptional regulator [Enterobacter sp. SORGH_AS_0287]